MKTNGVHIGWWLRAEALLELGLLLWVFAQLGGSWWGFAALFLLPDLTMLGYLKGPRWGAWAYNFSHTHVVAGGLALALWLAAPPEFNPLWLVWPAHIAFDRVFGYGLKKETGFGHTHLSI